jgi:hypothetical protein
MKNIINTFYLCLISAGSATAGDLLARASKSAYSLAKSVPWTPKNATSVDQGVASNGIYYLSDRTNKVVHAINISTGAEIAAIGGWKGTILKNSKANNSIGGPNGLLLLPNRNELYVGDSNGTVGVVSLKSYKRMANITTGSSTRADEMAYDPKSGIVVVTNPNEDTPYISIISAANHSVLGHISFPGASGLEQPAFNDADGKFYVSVPSTTTNPGGQIAVIDISSFSIAKTFNLPQIIPSGIVFGPTPYLFIGASADQVLSYNTSNNVVLDVTTGKIVANISGLAGVDQVAFDPTANLYFAAAYQNVAGGNGSSPAPVLAVIDAGSNTLVQKIATDNVTAHSVAVDPTSNAMIVPLTHRGIEIYNLGAAGTNSSTNSMGSGAGSNSSSSGSGSAASTFSVGGTLTLGCAGFAVTMGLALLE